MIDLATFRELEERVAALEARVAQLEPKPVPRRPNPQAPGYCWHGTLLTAGCSNCVFEHEHPEEEW